MHKRFNQERRFNRYRHTHSNIEYQKYMKQKLTQLKKMNSSTIVVEDFNAPFIIMALKKEYKKEIEGLNTVNQLI